MLQQKLSSLGHEIVDSPLDADLIVLNTCTVIGETERKMLKRMKDIASQRKSLVVSGCMASIQVDEILRAAPEALVVAPNSYGSFSSLIMEQFGGRGGEKKERKEVSAIVPIAKGCLGACTYCITKKARGILHSHPVEDIVEHVRSSINSGSKEILLTAQDTGCYGFDSNTNLAQLLERVTEVRGDFRIRVGMMNPDNLDKMEGEFIPAWMNKKVYKFVHLPVQTGSDRILEAMGRRYSAAQFEDQVSRLRKACPEMALATDVITGFPGESEDDHRASVELIKRVQPDIVNVTRFSPRPGTPAAKASGQIVGWMSKERSREMTTLRFEIAEKKNEAMVGRRERVLITEQGKCGTSIGRTMAYRQVIIPVGAPLGRFVEVEITRSAPTHLFARVVS